MNKRKIFKRVMSILLLFTMVTGIVGPVVAIADNGEKENTGKEPDTIQLTIDLGDKYDIGEKKNGDGKKTKSFILDIPKKMIEDENKGKTLRDFFNKKIEEEKTEESEELKKAKEKNIPNISKENQKEELTYEKMKIILVGIIEDEDDNKVKEGYKLKKWKQTESQEIEGKKKDEEKAKTELKKNEEENEKEDKNNILEKKLKDIFILKDKKYIPTTLKAEYELKEYEVIFDASDDENDVGWAYDKNIYKYTAKHGEKLKLPKYTPTKKGNKFIEWKENENGEYSLNEDYKVIEDITFKPKWESNDINTKEITFKEEVDFKIQHIVEDTDKEGIIQKPKDPTKSGYRFKNWYYKNNDGKEIGLEFKDEKCKIKLDEILEGGIHANWIEIFQIKFDTQGGSTISSIKVEEGETIKKPTNPTKADKTFAGWYIDKECKTKFNFDTVIRKNKTLYAKWVDKDTSPGSNGRYGVVRVTVENVDGYLDRDRTRYLVRRRLVDTYRNDTIVDVTIEALRDQGIRRYTTDRNDRTFTEIDRIYNDRDYEWKLYIDGRNYKDKGDLKVRDGEHYYWEYREIEDKIDKDKDENDKDKEDNDKETITPSKKGMLNIGYKQSFIDGYPNGRFQPEREISREEVAQIIYRVLDSTIRDNNISNVANYPDVAVGKWSTRPIATLDNLGILTGYNDGSFKPTRGIKRAEVASILSRVAELDGSSSRIFNDVSGHWAVSDINAVSQKGWIKGYENGEFRPERNITRAEFTSMLNNALSRTGPASSYMINKFTDINTGQWFYDDVLKGSNEVFD